MAKILLGNMIADIRGSQGGTTFSRNTFSNYMRNKTSPVNPNTVQQQLVRSRLTAMSQSWAGITEVLRQNWIDIAPSWSLTNIFNQAINYTGFSLYGRLNRNRQEINEVLIDTAPLPTDVDSFTGIDFAVDTSGFGTIITNFAPAIAADHKVIVRATRALSPGTNFVRNEYRKIAVLDSGDLTGIDLAAFYITTFGALPPVGSKIFIDMKQVFIATGQNTIPIKNQAIAT